jgi:PhnB protein
MIMMKVPGTFFAPHLYINKGVFDISFYQKAFDAIEHFCWNNEDGSVHVAELSIDGALFHLHEDKPAAGLLSPDNASGTTALIGLFVPDVDACIERALAAGGILVSPATSYDYGYRQGEIRDPFGHVWLIEMKI